MDPFSAADQEANTRRLHSVAPPELPTDRWEFDAAHPTEPGTWTARDCLLSREVILRIPAIGDRDPPRHQAIPLVLERLAASDGRVVGVEHAPTGVTLAEAIGQAEKGRPLPALATLAQRLALVIRIADALRSAHVQGHFHGDLTPHAILLNVEGEVWVRGWTSPLAESGEPVPEVGSGSRSYRIYHPSFYASPERIRGASPDALSDMYALAAICHHLVVGRPPLNSTTGTLSLRRKANGEIDHLSHGEAAITPPGVMVVLLAALQADRAVRQTDLAVFAGDLAKILDAALRATIVQPRRRIVPIALLSLMVLTGLMLLGLWVYERHDGPWGQPIIPEAMDDPSWLPRWESVNGTFLRDGATLITGNGNEHVLALNERYSPHIAVEFEGRMRAGAQPGDLSVMWIPVLNSAHGEGQRFNHDDVIKIQVGAYDNRYALITYRDRLAQAPFTLEPGRAYRIRAEIDGDRLSLDIDGKRICECTTLFPLPSGFPALYGYYPGKEFAKVRVFRQRPTPTVSPLAIGDAMFSEGLYDAAQRQYLEVTQSFSAEPLAQAAQFRLGLARERSGDTNGANRAWLALSSGPWAGHAKLMTAKRELMAGNSSQVLVLAEQIIALHPHLRAQAMELWTSTVAQNTAAGELAGLDQWTDGWKRLFRSDALASGALATALLASGHPGRVLQLMPNDRLAERARVVMGDTDAHVGQGLHDRLATLLALSIRGDFERILTAFPDQQWAVVRALMRLGRSSEIAELAPLETSLLPLAFGDWAAAEQSANPAVRAEALVIAGRLDEAAATIAGQLDNLGSCPVGTRIALLRGQARQEVEKAAIRNIPAPEAQAMLAIEHMAADESAAGRDLISAIQHLEDLPNRLDLDVASCLLPVAVELDADGAVAARRVLDDILARRSLTQGRRPWHMAALAVGRIDTAAFRAQPMQIGLEGSLVLTQALTAELAGDAAAATMAYRAWRDLPQLQRGPIRDPVAERFVTWRLDRLATKSAKAQP